VERGLLSQRSDVEGVSDSYAGTLAEVGTITEFNTENGINRERRTLAAHFFGFRASPVAHA